MFIVLDFVEFEVPKFGVEFVDIFDLVCLLVIPSPQLIIQTLDFLDCLNCFFLSHIFITNFKS